MQKLVVEKCHVSPNECHVAWDFTTLFSFLLTLENTSTLRNSFALLHCYQMSSKFLNFFFLNLISLFLSFSWCRFFGGCFFYFNTKFTAKMKNKSFFCFQNSSVELWMRFCAIRTRHSIQHLLIFHVLFLSTVL